MRVPSRLATDVMVRPLGATSLTVIETPTEGDPPVLVAVTV
jgi:hypothetical protein